MIHDLTNEWHLTVDDALAVVGFTAQQRLSIGVSYTEEYRRRCQNAGQDFDATTEAESALDDAISALPNAELPVAYSNGSLQIKFMKRILH